MRTRCVKRAFTLIEILIVVVILGILAAIVIPQFSEASDDAAASSVKSTLQTVRAQLELYKFKTGDYPAAIADMQAAGYLQSEPVAPAPYAFAYDGAGVYTAENGGVDTGW